MDEEQITDPVTEEVPTPPIVADVPLPETMVTEPVVAEPVPEQIIEPISDPVIGPETPVESAPSPEPVAPRPQITRSIPEPEPILVPTPEPPKAIDISSLSDTELRAAATLYTKRNQAEISRKGVAKRQETMELNLREIVDFLSLNNGSPLPRIAKHTNITLGTTSKYLRQLISSGKVRADGWGKTRRYYLT